MASYGCWAARRRMPLHFLLAAVVLLFARPVPELLGAGAILVAAGVAVRAWAAGHLRREGAVTVTGPYAHLRHPLYLGTAFILAGFAVAAGRAGLAALVGFYFVALFVPVMRREERERQAAASELYSAYASRVPAFLPRLRPAIFNEQKEMARARFDARLYLHNREWRSVLGCAALLAVLYGKMIWAG